MHVYIELASVSTETDRLRNIGKMYHMRRGQTAASLTSVRCQTQETPAIQPRDFHLLSTKNIHDKIIIIIVTNQLDIVYCTCTFLKKSLHADMDTVYIIKCKLFPVSMLD